MKNSGLSLKWDPKLNYWLIQPVGRPGGFALSHRALQELSRAIRQAIKDGRRRRVKPIIIGPPADQSDQAPAPAPQCPSGWADVLASFEISFRKLCREIDRIESTRSKQRACKTG